MSNRIDLTQFEGMAKGEWVYEEGVEGTGWVATLLIPHIGAETPEHPHGKPYPVLSASEHGYHLTRSDIKAMAAVPDLIAELKRCYEENDKMKYSIVKNRGDCWVCDMPIDSCDARSCERQMLEDIELGTASE